MKNLKELCRALPGAHVPRAAERVEVRAVQSDSREVRPGDVFVAVAGESEDGREHAGAAVAAGAVAVVSDAPLELPVPVVIVDDARHAAATLAAESLGRPADSLVLAGITGTIGKTSVLMMLSEILADAGIAAGIVGSLGIRHPGGGDATANTTPGAIPLQRALADMVAAGTRVAAMEVTSHALAQDRVHGLLYDIGTFTNLTMLEHLEYHGSFAEYAKTKRLFLGHLKPTAPLVYAAGDPVVRHVARRHPGPGVPCGGGGSTHVTVRRDELELAGTRVTLRVQRPLPRVAGPALQPLTFGLRLRTLGRAGTSNATLAAVTALCLGAGVDAVQSALARHAPPPRRLQVIRAADPIIIDDTVGHPDSITGVFEVAARAPHRRLVIVFCIRGQRGPVINARDAEAVAIWSRRVPVHELHITSAVDTADERNRVTAEERAAFLDVIRRSGMPHHAHHGRLEDAIEAALVSAGAGDLLLLLGAQGMDAGARLSLQALTGRQAGADQSPRISSE
jgi:UDP-N-acetylmuramoyl-L-alanyl-D-glutamate--2,6-diaminopimelate ligase